MGWSENISQAHIYDDFWDAVEYKLPWWLLAIAILIVGIVSSSVVVWVFWIICEIVHLIKLY